MARLRLFANLREAAGSSAVDVPGATVGEVLGRAASDYGEAFAAGLAHAKVWVNGEPAEDDTPVSDRDEVALIPPVSGGAVAIEAPAYTKVLLAGALVATLLLASFTSIQMLTVAVVAVASMWVWDLAGYAINRGLMLNVYPLLAAILAAAWGSYRWGQSGFAFAVAIALAVSLGWALITPEYRSLDSIMATILAAIVVALGVGSLVLLRARGADEVAGYLAVVIAAIVASFLVARFQDELPFLDPTIASLAGAIAAGAVAGVFLESWSEVFVASVVTAAALVAGRAVGSLLRSDEIYLVDTAPGYLTLLDGPLTAPGLFWMVLALFA